MVRVKWKDAEVVQDAELNQDWRKYKLTVHQTDGVIQHNGKGLLVLSSSKETKTSTGDVYIIPKDKWLLEIRLLKTKKELGK